MLATDTRPSLTLERRFAAAPDAVFAAWTDPAKVSRWFGPERVVRVEPEMDLRPGGRWRFALWTSDGEQHAVGGVYREVVPGRRLVFTWAWQSTPERESLVTVEVKPDGAGTLLTLVHAQLFDDETRERHGHGWTGSLDKLERLLATAA
ncbi:MAG: SRPBCC domain-containing protein [Alphaproteobacteria bacterium]